MSKVKKSLAETHPKLANQWHPKLNGDLTPNDVTYGSEKKVWWKCPEGDDHEYITQVNVKTRGASCAVCSGKTIVKSNSLATVKPDLAKQLHPIKNGKINALNIGPGSNKKVWWKCDKGDDHEWKVSVNSRVTFNSGCPFCSNHKLSKTNSLLNVYPKIAKQWHPTKNGELTASDVISGSNKKIWWKCDKGDDHEWITFLGNRVKGKSCPFCSGRYPDSKNNLETTRPEVAKFWHPTKNGELKPTDISKESSKKVWWKCDKGDDHEWFTSPNGITGCPFCTGRKVSKTNCLSNTHPEIAKQLHPTKNGHYTANKIYAGGTKNWWWKCDKGDDHVWKANLDNRIRQNQGCPFCTGQKVSKTNCLSNTHPEIAKQLHPTKNGHYTANKIYAGGTKNWWWKCDKGDDHVWKANLDNRIRQNQGCPYCTLTPQSKQELIITFELKKLFKKINPKGFKTKLDGRLRAIDIFIPKLNLCIEFDGSYWHKDKRDIDKIKSEMLFDKGFKLIRVREEPLKKIYDTDVISKRPYDGKKVTNDILSKIINIFNLDNKLVSKIKDYQSKEGLQNEKGLDIYIDQILTEKANKK